MVQRTRVVGSVHESTVILTGALLFAAGMAAPVLYKKVVMALKPGGKFSSINSSTAGARTQKELPVGQHPLQLYSCGTPNGQKVTCALEEIGDFKYDAYFINIGSGDQFTSGFVAVNPNSKIPSMVDKEGPGGKPINLFESASILLYLAEKSGKLLPKDAALRTECLNWLFFCQGSAPYLGQYGHFTKYAPVKIEYSINRYKQETQRILSVLDQHLKGKSFLVGNELTIADLAWFPWVRCLDTGYHAAEALELANYTEVSRWRQQLEARPAIAKGLQINGFDAPPELKEYHS